MWRRYLTLTVILAATVPSSGLDVTAHGACIVAQYLPQMGPMPTVWLPRPTTKLEAAALMAQWNPQPGNPGHQQPPPGWYCSHDARDKAHECACHRTCEIKQGEDENGNQTEEFVILEDTKCTVYCAKDHCACPTDCP